MGKKMLKGSCWYYLRTRILCKLEVRNLTRVLKIRDQNVRSSRIRNRGQEVCMIEQS
jgi:hypothetical protein